MVKVSFANTVDTRVYIPSSESEKTPLLSTSPETKKTAVVSRSFFGWLVSFFSCFRSKKRDIPDGKATLVQESREEVRQTAKKTEAVGVAILKKESTRSIPTVFKNEKTGECFDLNTKDTLTMSLGAFRKLPDDSLGISKFQTVHFANAKLIEIKEEDTAKFSKLIGKKHLSFWGSPNLTKLPVKALLSLPSTLTIDLRKIGYFDPDAKAKSKNEAYEAFKTARETGDSEQIEAARKVLNAKCEELDRPEKELEEAIKAIEEATRQKGYNGPKIIFSSRYERDEQRMTSAQKIEENKASYERETAAANYTSLSSSASLRGDSFIDSGNHSPELYKKVGKNTIDSQNMGYG